MGMPNRIEKELRKVESTASSSIVMTLDVYGHLFPGGDHHSKFAAGTRAIFA
jgi:hypothetical protein